MHRRWRQSIEKKRKENYFIVSRMAICCCCTIHERKQNKIVRNSVHRIGTIRSVSGGFAFYGNLAALIVFGGTGRPDDVRIGALRSRNLRRFIFYALRNPFRPRNSEKSAERRGKRATKMERKGKNEIQRWTNSSRIKCLGRVRRLKCRLTRANTTHRFYS